MFTKFQLYLLAGCIVAAAVIFAICESHQGVSPQQSISYTSDSVANTADTQHLPTIGDVTNETISADSEQRPSPSESLTDSSNGNINPIPESDYHDLKQAMTNFFSALNSMEKQITTTQDADGTVRLIEAWTAANNNLAKAMDAFSKKHPQITEGTLPPELLDMFTQFREMNQRYPLIPERLKELTKQFSDDPRVAAANEKFRQSQELFRQ